MLRPARCRWHRWFGKGTTMQTLAMVRSLFVSAVASVGLTAQSSAVVPPVCTALPGNAAVSMPLRWSHGTMQVFVDAQLLPANFVGQTITGLWLRRPTLPGDVAYAPITRTLTVRGGFLPFTASMMVGSITQNRPTNMVTLFGPAAVTSAAVPAPGPATVFGQDLVHVVFTTPLVVAAGMLFLEFETGNAPLQVSADHWVDAVWFQGGNDSGYVVPVGDGSCSLQTAPLRLRWTGSGGPTAGSTAQFEVTGVPSSGQFVLAWVGTDPQTRPAGPAYVGFGTSLGFVDPGMANCMVWVPLDVSWFGTTGAGGSFTTSLAIPGAAAQGLRLGVQAAWLDVSRPVLPLSVTNGLMLVVGSAGVGNHCNTIYFPAGTTVSPYPPFVGQMPVLRLDY
jgi:hypothetical protein